MRKILDLENNSEKWSSSSCGQSNNIVDTYASQRIHKQKRKKNMWTGIQVATHI